MDPPSLGEGGDLRKAALKGRLGASRPPLGALSETAEVCGDTPALGTSILGGPLTGHHPYLHPGAAGPMGPPPARKPITPVGWQQYWERRDTVHVEGRGSFNVYSCGSSGPVVLCIHGGGYTGLTWSLVAEKLKDKYRVVAPDLRGHGLTTTSDDVDFSKETMSEDIVQLWLALSAPGSILSSASSRAEGTAGTAAGAAGATGVEGSGAAAGTSGATGVAGVASPSPASGASAAAPGSSSRPSMLLVGHSMGGALATWAAASGRMEGIAGLVVIDVVEGTAIAALPYMEGVLGSRPGHFASPEEGIAWCTRTGMCKSKAAAAVSMPSQLRREPPEEQGEPQVGEQVRWVWRTPLDKSQPHWSAWYTGLSEQFMQVPCPKMLLLAGTDRLDKVLTIGQMQGKFQLAVLPMAGHAIQEDEATRTAEHLQQFLQRFRIGLPPMQVPRAQFGVRPVLPVAAGPPV